MYNLFFKTKELVCLFAIMTYCTVGFSQTTTINYLTSGLSTTACNVFSPNVPVNGITHSSLAGGVSFNSTYGIFLAVSNNTTSIEGTAYVISYNFNPGYNYDISITASGDKAMHLKTSAVPNLNAFATSSMSSCTLDANVPNYNTTAYGQSDLVGINSSKIYTIPQFYIPFANNSPIYLVIWASGGDVSLSSDVFSISKIVITKTSPTASFTLPTSTTFGCGTTTPKTFTVTNVHGTTGITNYTWNLGSASNGWLYNGNPAPQTISTGTTNTLTLTPVCGGSQGNIYATVTANGNNYTTNSSTVSITPPSMSISGNSSLCSGTSTYSISNVPCNATVTWSASPSGIVSLSPNGGTVAVTKIINGGVILTATINACTIYSVHTSIAVGGPYPAYGIYSTDGTTSYCVSGGPYGFEALGASGDPLGYEWIDYGPTQTQYYYNQGDQIQLSFNGVGKHTIAIIASNSCGSAPAVTTTIDVASCNGWAFKASPNPANSSLNISLDDQTIETNKTISIREIQVTDKMGNVVKQIKYDAAIKRATLNISQLKSDIYYIRVFNGKEWKTQSISKE